MSHRRGRIWYDKLRGDGMKLTSRPLSSQERRATARDSWDDLDFDINGLDNWDWDWEDSGDPHWEWTLLHQNRPLRASFLELAAS